MPKYKVIGFSEFIGSKSHKPWVNVYVTFEDKDTTGVRCHKFFCSPDVIQGKLELGKIVLPIFRENSSYVEALQVF